MIEICLKSICRAKKSIEKVQFMVCFDWNTLNRKLLVFYSENFI